MNTLTKSASRLLLGGALLSLAALLTAPLARADSDDAYGAFTVAVIGDWPYANTATTPPSSRRAAFQPSTRSPDWARTRTFCCSPPAAIAYPVMTPLAETESTEVGSA